MPTKQTAVVLDAEKIRQLREKLGLTLQQAADAAGMNNRQQWHEVESGNQANLKLATLNAIAAALGVNAKSLLK
jgi:transcriptional regulator with XRE-family HTH domain